MTLCDGCHATKVSILRSQRLKKFEKTFGYITKFNREAQGKIVALNSKYLVRRLISKDDYQQRKGIRSEKKIPTGKSHGFRKFDLIYSRSKKELELLKEKGPRDTLRFQIYLERPFTTQ